MRQCPSGEYTEFSLERRDATVASRNYFDCCMTAERNASVWTEEVATVVRPEDSTAAYSWKCIYAILKVLNPPSQ
jgi:hypothetical protein